MNATETQPEPVFKTGDPVRLVQDFKVSVAGRVTLLRRGLDAVVVCVTPSAAGIRTIETNEHHWIDPAFLELAPLRVESKEKTTTPAQTFDKIQAAIDELTGRRVVTTAEARCYCGGCDKTLPCGAAGVVKGIVVSKGAPRWLVNVQCGESAWQLIPGVLAFAEAAGKSGP